MKYQIFLLYFLILFCLTSFWSKNRLDNQVCASENLLPINETAGILLNPNITIHYDPPPGTVSPTALGIYVWSNIPTAKIYYTLFSGQFPNINSSHATAYRPYIQVDTPFKAPRNRTINLIAVYTDAKGNTWRSEMVQLHYFVEAAARPYSFGYLIPGVESGGMFVQFQLEVAASARAQAAGAQEFADFFSKRGYGTYPNQVQGLNLLRIDPDLNGFEGGFTCKFYPRVFFCIFILITVVADNASHYGGYYGILIPYYNGRVRSLLSRFLIPLCLNSLFSKEFYGKVVKVDLYQMRNTSHCRESYVIETMVNGEIVRTGSKWNDTANACVHVIDLMSVNPLARGFRRGFLGWPYGYLSPGTDQTAVRLDLLHFGLNSTRFIDLSKVSPTFGGYSGGFTDHVWACYT